MKYQIKEIKITDELYPEKLKHIYDPPKTLYCIGNVSLLNNYSIAIIGCRNASDYGLKISKIFADNLSKIGVTIISGFANGIDSESHRASLNNIGKTIAVFACGLDYIYPEENKMLYYEILKNDGLIISEYPLGVKPIKEYFPNRNRIISGLSSGVLVVEAKRKSGTMITVRHALDQGRDVFVIPGNIDSINSTGTNELIKEGAKMVTNYKEIIENHLFT